MDCTVGEIKGLPALPGTSRTIVLLNKCSEVITHLIVRFVTVLRSDSFDSVEEIRRVVPTFQKIPSHVVLILGPEEPSYVDFVKVISWSFTAGISYISFYDHKNGIDSGLLFDAVSKLGRQYIPNIKWGKSFGWPIKAQSKNCINGFSWNPLLTVNIYKNEDGLERIVETVKKFHKNGVEDVHQNNLNKSLQQYFNAPDPDLAIVCGSTLSYFAFPPWHLRITQMLKLCSHHNFTVSKFLHLLSQYCKCEQRYGK